MRKLRDKLREKRMSLWGIDPTTSFLEREREEEKKGNIMGVMGIELGSPKSKKCNHQV